MLFCGIGAYRSTVHSLHRSGSLGCSWTCLRQPLVATDHRNPGSDKYALSIALNIKVQNHPYHDIGFPFCIAQIWVQPVHQSLHLVPVEEDEEDKEQEVNNTETYRGQERGLRNKTNANWIYAAKSDRTGHLPKTIRHTAGCGLVNGPDEENIIRIFFAVFMLKMLGLLA